jgi:hypothetical protein
LKGKAMRFWTREIAGWLLVVLGLYVFYRSYTIMTEENPGSYHYVLEGGALTVIGVFLFRGGIQLLRVAVAAQVFMEAQERLERDRTKPGGMPAPSRSLPGRRSSLYPDKPSRTLETDDRRGAAAYSRPRLRRGCRPAGCLHRLFLALAVRCLITQGGAGKSLAKSRCSG